MSISVAVCCVILVGTNTSGIYDDLEKNFKNRLVYIYNHKILILISQY
jgi:hypothetical protein